MKLIVLLVIALVQSDGYLDIHRFDMASMAECQAAVAALADRTHLRVGCVQDIDMWRQTP